MPANIGSAEKLFTEFYERVCLNQSDRPGPREPLVHEFIKNKLEDRCTPDHLRRKLQVADEILDERSHIRSSAAFAKKQKGANETAGATKAGRSRCSITAWQKKVRAVLPKMHACISLMLIFCATRRSLRI